MLTAYDAITRLNRQHKLNASRQLIEDALQLGQRPFVSTKFGPHSAVLLHLVTTAAPDIPVVWIDTGYNTRATQHFVTLLRQQLAFNLQVFRPEPQTPDWPPALDDPTHAEFTRRVKLEPFARALDTLQPDIWFSGLRREQTAYRAGLDHYDRTRTGLLKVNPLLDWNQVDLEAYLAEHGLPSEPDYYDPTKGEPRRECGLHLRF